MSRRSKYIFLQIKHADGQQAQEKMFNLAKSYKKSSENYNEILPHTSQNSIIKNLQTINYLVVVEKKRTLPNCCLECKLVQSPKWTEWKFLKKLKIELPYDPSIPLLDMYLEKNMVQNRACPAIFTAVLYTIARHESNLNVHQQMDR